MICDLAATATAGTMELPEPPDSGVTLAAVAHSVQTDIRRKFAATHEDILQYIDKCEYLFEHDEFYDKSYKALARTVTELNRQISNFLPLELVC